jgi:hypothetical protein
MTGVLAQRLIRSEPGFDLNAALAQLGMSLAGDLRVWVLDRRHDAGYPRADDGIDAGRRFALMRARFERYIERAATGGLAGAFDRLGLGVWPAAVASTGNDDAILHDPGKPPDEPGWPRPRRPSASASCMKRRSWPSPGAVATAVILRDDFRR